MHDRNLNSSKIHQIYLKAHRLSRFSTITLSYHFIFPYSTLCNKIIRAFYIVHFFYSFRLIMDNYNTLSHDWSFRSINYYPAICYYRYGDIRNKASGKSCVWLKNCMLFQLWLDFISLNENHVGMIHFTRSHPAISEYTGLSECIARPLYV